MKYAIGTVTGSLYSLGVAPTSRIIPCVTRKDPELASERVASTLKRWLRVSAIAGIQLKLAGATLSLSSNIMAESAGVTSLRLIQQIQQKNATAVV